MKEPPHSTTHKENLARLNRVEGQVRGVRRMIEEGAYCIDILTQIQAAQSAMGAVARKILSKHLESCVTEAVQSKSKEKADEKIRELQTTMKRMCK